MPRRPEPWFWTARRAWFVQIKGKQIRLAEDKDEAYREYYRLMAASGELTDAEMSRALVPDVLEAFLASKSKMRERTIKSYGYHLKPYAVAFKSRKLGTLRPNEVIKVTDNVDT